MFRIVTEGLKQYLSDDLREMARQEMLKARKSSQGRHAQILVKQPLNLTWGKNELYDKFPILTKMLGFRPAMRIKRDELCMRQYLDKVSPNSLQDPELGKF